MLRSSLDLLSTATRPLRQRPMLDFHQGGHGTREEHEQVLRLRPEGGQPVQYLVWPKNRCGRRRAGEGGGGTCAVAMEKKMPLKTWPVASRQQSGITGLLVERSNSNCTSDAAYARTFGSVRSASTLRIGCTAMGVSYASPMRHSAWA